MSYGARISKALLCLLLAAMLSACDLSPQPTATATLESTATRMPEPTATWTPEPTLTHTPSPSSTPTQEPTATHTPTSTSTPEPTATATATPTATYTTTPSPTPTYTSTPTPTATSTPEPTSTATPTQVTPAELAVRVSSSIVFVETAARRGNGVLIEGGFVVTNAEVVWPFEEVRIVLPDGSEFLEVPVKGFDFISDLAVIGPIDSPTLGVELADSEFPEEGSDVFVIGYPGEPEDFGQPLVESRAARGTSDFEGIGITFLHTRAISLTYGESASLYSGWALVSELGEVVGVLGRRPEGTPFEVSASTADILPRVRQIIAGEDPFNLGDRRIPFEGGRASSRARAGALLGTACLRDQRDAGNRN